MKIKDLKELIAPLDDDLNIVIESIADDGGLYNVDIDFNQTGSSVVIDVLCDDTTVIRG